MSALASTSAHSEPFAPPSREASSRPHDQRGRFPIHVVLLGLVSFLLLGNSSGNLPIQYAIRYDTLHIAFRVVDSLSPRYLDRVSSGLTAPLTIQASILTLSSDDSVIEMAGSPFFRRCEIQYDLWAETYMVEIRDTLATRRWLAGERDDAISICASVGWVPIAGLEDLDLRRRYVVEVVVNTDPDRPDARERTREHLGDPARGSSEGSGGRSLFGAVVQALFREKTEEPSPAFRLRGAPFGEPLLGRTLAEAGPVEEEESDAVTHDEIEEER